MIDGLYSALSALNTAEKKQAITANNVANANTPGYKAKVANLGDMNTGGVNILSVESPDGTNYLIETGNNLDLAINGNGYFRLNNNNNSPVLTRNGSFRVDSENHIVDAAGNILFDLPANFTTNDIKSISIDENGFIYNGGELTGALNIVDAYGNIMPPNTYEILSGYLEASNVDMAREIIDSMVNLRYLQANTKTVQTTDEMLGNIIDLKK
jgi:flagellar basal body rod protein FlgG